MRFIIGVDAYRFHGEKIERSLRPHFDIAEYEIMPRWERLKLLVSNPENIQARAQILVNRLHQEAEAALYYIGFTRGFYLHQAPRAGRQEIFSICLDVAVATDRLRKRNICVCLNSSCVNRRLESLGRAPLNDDDESLESLLTLINSFCLEELSTTS